MKNKGFTIIEFAISFCMMAAISITLFQLITSMQQLYLSGNVKTTLLNKQGILTKRIYDDIYDYQLTKIEPCGASCLTFTYLTDETTNETKTAELLLDPYNLLITYDNYSVKLDNGSYFGRVSFEDCESIADNLSIFYLNIPIYNKLVDGNFGINIVIQYDEEVTNIDNDINTLTNTTLSLDGQEVEVIRYDGNYYAKIFYHDITGSNVFSNKEEFLKSNTATKYSALFALDLFRGAYNSSENDVYQFMLKYPSLSTTSSNRWYQESNFIKEEITGFEAIDIVWNANWNNIGHFNGINKITDTNSCGFAIMTNEQNSNGNCYMTLGAKKAINGKLMIRSTTDYSSSDVELYVRIDDYLYNYALNEY